MSVEWLASVTEAYECVAALGQCSIALFQVISTEQHISFIILGISKLGIFYLFWSCDYWQNCQHVWKYEISEENHLPGTKRAPQALRRGNFGVLHCFAL